MIKLMLAIIFLVLGLGLVSWFVLTDNTATNTMIENKTPTPDNAAVATLAGGCFWCTEAAFEGGMPGVYEAVSGFSGGKEQDASYALVAEGGTGHKEAAQVFYDPKVVSFDEILEVFWQQIDPTDDGGQFADRGDHYTTAIFYHTEAQRVLAEASKKALIDSGKFDDPIVTEILPYSGFYPAAESHQDFAQKQSAYYQAYKYGSGRGGFIDKIWKKEK